MSIGAIIEENQEDHYISKNSGARARAVLILIWIVFGFLLTISYKSVLRSNMLHIYYDSPIDSVEDLLRTDKSLFVVGGTSITKLLDSDKREKIVQLNKRVIYYKRGNGSAPIWISEGQV